MMQRETIERLISDIYQLVELSKELGKRNIGSEIYLYGGIPAYMDLDTGKYSFTSTERCSFDYNSYVLNLVYESIVNKYAPKENIGDADEITTALNYLNEEIKKRKECD